MSEITLDAFAGTPTEATLILLTKDEIGRNIRESPRLVIERDGNKVVLRYDQLRQYLNRWDEMLGWARISNEIYSP